MNSTITWKKYLSTVLVIAFPIALQSVLNNIAGLLDTIMIGSQGELSVAAVGICNQFAGLYYQSFWGFTCGSLVFFAQYWGVNDEDGINRTFGITLPFVVLIGSAFGTVSVFKPEFVLGIYTDKESIIELAIPYMRILGIAFYIQTINMILNMFLRSTERVKILLYSSIVTMITNFCINWTLIYGRYGFPKMGAAGAAVGTTVTFFIQLLILAVYIAKSECRVRLHWSKMWHYSAAEVWIYLKKSAPIVANEALYGVGMMFVNIVLGHQDEAAIAAVAAFRICENFVYSFFSGLSNASSVVSGREIGAGNLRDGYAYAWKSALFCPVVTFGVVGICFIFYKPLFTLFGLGAMALNYARYMLLIYLFFGSIRTCNYLMNECFRAGGETVVGSVIEIGGLLLITVPATWIAGMVLHLPFLLVVAFMYTDELVRLVVEGVYLRSARWIKPVTPEGQAAVSAFVEERHRVKKKAM